METYEKITGFISTSKDIGLINTLYSDWQIMYIFIIIIVYFSLHAFILIGIWIITRPMTLEELSSYGIKMFFIDIIVFFRENYKTYKEFHTAVLIISALISLVLTVFFLNVLPHNKNGFDFSNFFVFWCFFNYTAINFYILKNYYKWFDAIEYYYDMPKSESTTSYIKMIWTWFTTSVPVIVMSANTIYFFIDTNTNYVFLEFIIKLLYFYLIHYLRYNLNTEYFSDRMHYLGKPSALWIFLYILYMVFLWVELERFS